MTHQTISQPARLGRVKQFRIIFVAIVFRLYYVHYAHIHRYNTDIKWLDGVVVDVPVVKRARALLDLAENMKLLGQ